MVWGFVFIILKGFLPLVIPSLTNWLFRSVLFNFYIFVNFSIFLLFLISNFIPLWSKNILGVISVLLGLFRLVLRPYIQSILENVPCALEKKVYSPFVECSVSVRSSWIITVLFNLVYQNLRDCNICSTHILYLLNNTRLF